MDHIAKLSGQQPCTPSPIEGGRVAAEKALTAINPAAYAATRNFLDGAVTRLSPYIRQGILSLDEVRNHALSIEPDQKKVEKFIQELAWRDYWQRVYAAYPERIWNDVEAYKTGFDSVSMKQICLKILLQDRQASPASTTSSGRCWKLDICTITLACMWHPMSCTGGAFAGRQAPAGFCRNLLDGDPASNNLSWQWVASTFSNKPYIFNLENVAKYTGHEVNTRFADNRVLGYSYEQLNELLFPNLAQMSGGQHG